MSKHHPQQRQADQLAQQTNIQVSSFYQGQIPPPDLMEHYQRILPSLPERIMKMAEDEQKNRHRNNNRTTRLYIISTYLGLVFAFLSVVLVCYLVYCALEKGYPTQGTVIASGVIVGIASVFVYRKKFAK